MSLVKPLIASSNLKRKGFVEIRKGDHIHYIFVDPRTNSETNIKTKMSHNSGPLDNDLLNHMKKQLHFLSKKDLVDFLVCNIDCDEYCRILLSQGLI